MILRLSKLLVALALASSIGLHWAFLQVVAWSGMVISYSQDRPVAEAVADTFDGQHPCKLCKQIAKEHRSENKAEYKFELGKVKFRYAPCHFAIARPSALCEIPAPDDNAELLTHSPPVPPPRVFIG